MPHPPPSPLLVAEEDDAVRAYLTRVLAAAGYAVTPVACGAEALALLTAGRFDAAVLDGRMPGLSGPEVLARLRPTRPELPVLVVSGGAGLVVAEDRHTRFLAKPFPPAALLAALAGLLGR